MQPILRKLAVARFLQLSSTELEDTATAIIRNDLVLDVTRCSTLQVHASTVGRPTQEPDADEEGVDGYT